MSICCASNCGNKPLAGNGKTFYLFPFSQPEICKKWVMNVNGDKWQPNQRTVLCSDHFEENQFDISGTTVKLKPCAIPTLFNSSKQDSSLTNVPSSHSSLQSTLPSLPSVQIDDQSQLSNVKITSVTSLARPTQSGPQILLINKQLLSSPIIKLPINLDQIFGNKSSTVNALQPTADQSSPMIKRRKIFITSIEKLPEKPESMPVKDASLEPILAEPSRPVAAPTIAAPALIRPALSLFKLAPTLIGPPNSIKPATSQMRPALSLLKPAPILIKRAPLPIKPEPKPIKRDPTPIKPAPTPIKPAPTLIKPAPAPIKLATTLIKPAPTSIKLATTPATDPKSTFQEIVLDDHHYYTKPNSEETKPNQSQTKTKQALTSANVDTKRNDKLKPLKKKVRQLEAKIRSMNKTIDSLKKEQVSSKEMFTKQASTVLTNLQRSAATSSKATCCTAVFIRSLH